ncbi:DUF6923 family protein [Longispora albida]|uniref:DUF6923 family protein n=1 Tax=Longispora albida TaxID=203523 RepID=UPI00037CB17C|nr:GEVED domain-containing protein [Longispora albida]
MVARGILRRFRAGLALTCAAGLLALASPVAAAPPPSPAATAKPKPSRAPAATASGKPSASPSAKPSASPSAKPPKSQAAPVKAAPAPASKPPSRVNRMPEAGGCGAFAYTAVGTGPTNLYKFDPILGTMTLVPGTSHANGYDAIGYSSLTGKVYGAQVSGDRSTNMVEIDPEAGTVTKIAFSGTQAVSDTAFDQGAVSPDGRDYYITRNSTSGAYVINLDSTRGAVGRVLSKISGYDQYDLAYHPNDGSIYSVNSSGNLVRINPLTGASTAGRNVAPAAKYMAIVFSSDGTLFAVDDSSPQKVYQLDLSASTAASPISITTGPKATQIGTIKPGTTVADGGGCLRLRDYGDAPDTYTTVYPDGPAHNMVPGLKLGAGTDQEPNARPSVVNGVTGSLDGRGDTFDDGVATWPVLRTDSTSYAIDVAVTNTTAAPVTLAGWLDFDNSGTFDDGERVTATVAASATTATLTWSGLSGGVAGLSYVRLRLYDSAVTEPTPSGGQAGNGEVEDYPLSVRPPATDLCTSSVYVSLGTGPTDLYQFNPLLGTSTLLANTRYANGYDAVGVSGVNGRVYGTTRGADKYTKLVEINPAGGVTEYSFSPALTSNGGSVYDVGAVSPDGARLYVHSNSSVPTFIVNLDPGVAPIGTVLGQIQVNPGSSGLYDWAFHPADVYLYSVDASGFLFRVDPATGAVTKSSSALLPAAQYRGAFFDTEGDLYVLDNSTPSKVYQIDLSTSKPGALISLNGVQFSQIGAVPTTSAASDAGGCLKVADYGDAPDSYKTSVAAGGPSHNRIAALGIGAKASVESDARRPIVAGAAGPLDGTGDTFDDGVAAWPQLSVGDTTYSVAVTVRNTTGTAATLAGWIDVDGNGSFDAGERATVSVPNNATTATLAWSGLTGVARGRTYARLRLYEGTVTPFPAADDPAPAGAVATGGEVEDYRIPIASATPCVSYAYLAVGTAPTDLYRYDLMLGTMTLVPGGTLAGGYDAMGYNKTDGLLYAVSKDNKLVVINPAAGTLVTKTIAGLPSNSSTWQLGAVTENGDYLVVTGGSTSSSAVIDLRGEQPTATATNPPGTGGWWDWAYHPADGRLYAADGSSGDLLYADPSKSPQKVVLKSSAVPTGTNYKAVFFGEDGTFYFLATTGRLYQLDLSSSTAASPITSANVPAAVQISSLAGNPDVADAAGCLRSAEFGDAPDSYKTSTAADGPVHKLTAGLRLGPKIDAEPDARRPIVNGTAGALNGLGDTSDDAIATVAALGKEDTRYVASVKVTNSSGKPVTLAGWFDSNLDGQFQPGERVTATVPSAAGEQTVALTWTVPAARPSGTSYLRLRLFDDVVADPSSFGEAAGGEAEDYPVTVTSYPAIDLRIATDPLTLTPGSSGTLPVRVTNDGPDASDIPATVTLTPPTGTTFGTPPAGCVKNADGTVTCTIAASDLAKGATKALAIPITVNPDAPPNASPLPGGTAVVGSPRDTNPANNTAPIVINTGAAQFDVAMKSATGPGPLPPGSTATVTVVATNSGPSNTTVDSTVTITLPANVSVSGTLPAGCTGTGPVTCTVAAGWATGTDKSFAIPVKIASNAPVNSTLSGGKAVVAATGDTVTTNNEKPFTMSTTGASTDLAVTAATVTPAGALPPGSTATVMVTANNVGPSDSRSASTVTITLPSSVDVAGPLPAGCTGAAPITCTVPAGWVAGTDKSFVIPVKIASNAPLNTTLNGGKAVVTGADDTVAANNEKPFTMSTTGASTDLAVTAATVTPAGPLAPGSAATVTVTANNVGPSDARSASTVTITLPASVSVSGTLPAGCTGTGPVTCTVPAGWVAGTDKSFVIPVKIASNAPLNTTLTGGKAVVDGADDTVAANNEKPFTMSTTAQAASDISVTATGPGTLPPGGSGSVTVTARNNGPSDTGSATTVTITIPAGATAGTLPAGCTGTNPVTCTVPAGWQNGTDKVFVIPVTVAPDAAPDTTLTGGQATVSNPDDTVATNNTASYVIPVGPRSADVSITKAAVGTAKVAPGETFGYDVTVTNNGPSIAVNVQVTDTLPAALSFVSSDPAGCTASGQTVTCPKLATLAGSQAYRLTVRLDPAYTGDGSDVRNTATVSADSPDPKPGNNTAEAGLPDGGPAPVQADLAITKATANAAKVAPGETFDYVLTVTNNGPSVAKDVQITDDLPAELIFVSSNPAGCTAAGQQVTCPKTATLGRLGTTSVTLTVRLASGYTGDGSEVRNTGRVASATTDPQTDNNTATAGVPGGNTAPAKADVKVSKTTGTTQVAPGEEFEYTLVMTNDGPSDAAGAQLTDTLPSALTWVSGCSASGSTVTCPAETSLPAGMSKTYKIKVKLSSSYAGDGTGSDVTNSATVASSTADPRTDNNTAKAGLPGGSPASRKWDLGIAATSPATPIQPGGTGTVKVTVTHNGPSDTNMAATVTITLPAKVSPGVLPAGCTGSGPVTCTIGGGFAAGTQKEFDLPIVVAADAAPDSTLTGGQAAVSITGDTLASNDTAPFTVPVGGRSANLVTTKAPQGGPVAPGEEFSYRVVMTNNGPSDAINAKVTDQLPAALVFVSSDPAGCTASGQNVTCPVVPVLAAKDSRTYLLRVRLSAAYTGDGSDIRNVACSTSDTPNPGPGNGCSDASTGTLPDSKPAPKKIDLATAVAAPAAPVTPGTAMSITVTITNNGPSTSNAANHVITLPAKVTPGTLPSGCTGTGPVTCTVPAGMLPGETRDYVIPLLVAPDAAPDSTLTGGKDVVTEPLDSVPANNEAPFEIRVGPRSADVAITKAPVGTTQVAPGETFGYDVTVTNNGPSDAVNVQVTDTLPAELTFVSSTPEGCTASGRTVTCPKIATLTGSQAYRLTVRLDPAFSGTNVRNVATASADSADPKPDNNTAEAGLPGGGPAPANADVSLTKATTTTTKPAPGETFGYTLTATNNGPSQAKEVQLTDDLPAGLTLVSSTPDGCTAAGQKVTCPKTAAVDRLGTVTVTLTVRLASGYTGGDLENTATVTSSTPDPVPANNTAKAGLPGGGPAAPKADLKVTKATADSKQVAPGQEFDYTLVMTNDGPSDATGAQLTDTLPGMLTWVSGCSASGSTVTCPKEASLPVAASKTYTIRVRLASGYAGNGSDVVNTATVSSATADPDSANNTATAGLPGGTPAARIWDLGVTATSPATPIVPGGTGTVKVTVTHNGPSDTSTAATVTITLPAKVTPGTLPSGCTGTGPVTCTIPAGFVAGTTKEFDLPIVVAPDAAPDSTLTGGQAAVAITGDTVAGNNTAPFTVPVAAASADVAITKATASTTRVAPGEEFDYVIEVTNNGPSDAAGVQVTDELPAALTWVSGCSASGRTVTCPQLAVLAAKGKQSYTVRVRLDVAYTGDGTDIRNIARAATTSADPNPANNTAEAGLPGGGPANRKIDLATAVTAPAAPVTPGTATSITVTITNNGPSATAATAKHTVTLPAKATVGSPLPAGCTGTGPITCTVPAGMIPGATKTYVIPLLVAPDADSTLTGGKDVVAEPLDGVPGNNEAPFVIPVGPRSADVALTKAPAGTTKIAPGETFDYNLTVTNNGPSTAVGVQVTDTLPAELTFLSSTPAGCTAAGRTVTCPQIPALSGTQSYKLTVRLDPAFTGADVRNVAAASASSPDPKPANNTAEAGLPGGGPAPAKADLSITKSTPATKIGAGSEFDFRFEVRNAGPSVATGVTISDTLPAPFAFLSSMDGCTAAGQQVSCPGDTLAPGAAVTRTIRVLLSPAYTGDGSDLANTATVSSGTADPVPGNNSHTWRPPDGMITRPVTDMSVTKTLADGRAIAPGETYDYIVTATNNGKATAAVNVIVMDPLPPMLSFVSSTPACTAQGQLVTCPVVPNVAPGDDLVYTVTVRLDPAYAGDGSDIANIAKVTADNADNDLDNNSSKADGVPGGKVKPPIADVALTITEPANLVVPGDADKVLVHLTNLGPSSVREDTPAEIVMPPHVTAGTPLPSNCTAASAGTVVNCTVPPGLRPESARRTEAATTLTIPIVIAAGAPGNSVLTPGTARHTRASDPVLENNSATWKVRTGPARPVPPAPVPPIPVTGTPFWAIAGWGLGCLVIGALLLVLIRRDQEA